MWSYSVSYINLYQYTPDSNFVICWDLPDIYNNLIRDIKETFGSNVSFVLLLLLTLVEMLGKYNDIKVFHLVIAFSNFRIQKVLYQWKKK